MSNKDEAPGFWTIVKWAAWIIALIAVIGFVGSLVGTATKVATAPGRVLNKTLETNNIIDSYEWFYDTNAAFISRQNQVVQYNTMYAEEEDKSEKRKIRTELAAMQQTCRDLVTKYNANSEKMNKSIFKGWELPHSLYIEDCN